MDRRGFTLIEMMIAAAIVAILAAAAAPLMLQSQARANVARARADMWRLKVAAEAYRADYGRYMLDDVRVGGRPAPDMHSWTLLTTPAAYLASVPVSPFLEYKGPASNPPYTGQSINPGNYFEYWCGNFNSGGGSYPVDTGASETGIYWRGNSVGPDKLADLHNSYGMTGAAFTARDIANRKPLFVNMLYDPSNGTLSRGDLFFTNQGLIR